MNTLPPQQEATSTHGNLLSVSKRLSRRRFMTTAAGTVAAGAVGGTALAPSKTGPAPVLNPLATEPVADTSTAAALRALGRTTLRLPGPRPEPGLPAGADLLPGIDHIVVLMMESHSFDNLFGLLGRGDGFTSDANGQPTATNPYPDGRIQHAFRMPTTCQLSSRPSQEWTASHNACNNGRNEGFVRTPISTVHDRNRGRRGHGLLGPAKTAFTYSLAATFPIGDRWFCSLLGQTDPNRRYLIAGTSAGMTDDISLSVSLSAIIPDLGLPPWQRHHLRLPGPAPDQLGQLLGQLPGRVDPELYPVDNTLSD